MDRIVSFLNNRYIIAAMSLLFVLGFVRSLRR